MARASKASGGRVGKRRVDAAHVMVTEPTKIPRYQWDDERQTLDGDAEYDPLPFGSLLTIVVSLLGILGLWLSRGWRWN